MLRSASGVEAKLGEESCLRVRLAVTKSDEELGTKGNCERVSYQQSARQQQSTAFCHNLRHRVFASKLVQEGTHVHVKQLNAENSSASAQDLRSGTYQLTDYLQTHLSLRYSDLH